MTPLYYVIRISGGGVSRFRSLDLLSAEVIASVVRVVDSGVYTCQATSPNSITTSAIEVRVEGMSIWPKFIIIALTS